MADRVSDEAALWVAAKESLEEYKEELRTMRAAGSVYSTAEKDAQQDKIELQNEFLALLKEEGAQEAENIEKLRDKEALNDRILGEELTRFQRREVDRIKQRDEDERRKKEIKFLLDRVNNLTAAEEKRLKLLIADNAEAEKRNDYLREAKDLAGSIASSFNSYGKHPFFNVNTIANITGAMKNFGEFVANTLEGAAFGVIDSMLNLIFEMNKHEAALKKAVRASDDFNSSLRDTYSEVRANVVSMDTFYESVEDLAKGFTDFTQISQSSANEVAKITSTMIQAGHSSKALTKDIQLLTVSFGMLPKQATQTLLELEAFADDIGLPAPQLTEKFGALGAELTKLGQDGVRAFKDLARVFKITGLEMDKILKMTNRFDTFEGAADQAGRLNAAIGGNFVNAMDLMTATDPIERFEMLRNSLLQAGLEFDNMSYYQRIFFKESLGLESVADLAAMMRGDLSSLDAEIGQNAASYEEMAKKAKESADFQARLNALMQQMIPVLGGVIDGIDRALDSLERGNPNLIDVFKLLGSIMGAMIEHWEATLTILAAWKVGIPLATFLWAQFGTAAAAAATGGTAMSAAITSVGVAAARATPGLLILTGVFAAIGLAALGIGAVFSGLASMLSAFDSDKLWDLSKWIASVNVGTIMFWNASRAIGSLAESIGEVGEALNNLDAGKMRAIAQLSKIATVGASIPKAAQIELADAINTAVSMPVVLGAAQATLGAGGGGGTTDKVVLYAEIPVYVDGKEIERKTLKSIATSKKRSVMSSLVNAGIPPGAGTSTPGRP